MVWGERKKKKKGSGIIHSRFFSPSPFDDGGGQHRTGGHGKAGRGLRLCAVQSKECDAKVFQRKTHRSAARVFWTRR